MASSLTCVVSSLPFIKEIDSDTRYIDVIPQGDTLKAVERIVYWAENREERGKIGRDSREYVLQHFNPKKMTDVWEGYLNNILGPGTEK